MAARQRPSAVALWLAAEKSNVCAGVHMAPQVWQAYSIACTVIVRLGGGSRTWYNGKTFN